MLLPTYGSVSIARNWATSIAGSQNSATRMNSIRCRTKSTLIWALFCTGPDTMTIRSTNGHQGIASDPSFAPNEVALCWALEAKGDAKAALDACKQAVEHLDHNTQLPGPGRSCYTIAFRTLRGWPGDRDWVVKRAPMSSSEIAAPRKTCK